MCFKYIKLAYTICAQFFLNCTQILVLNLIALEWSQCLTTIIYFSFCCYIQSSALLTYVYPVSFSYEYPILQSLLRFGLQAKVTLVIRLHMAVVFNMIDFCLLGLHRADGMTGQQQAHDKPTIFDLHEKCESM